jgi:flagellar biosynthesis/type III secretory pathway protein FliH
MIIKWVPPSFDPPAPEVVAPPPPPPPKVEIILPAVIEEPVIVVPQITEEEVAQIRQDAYDAGFSEGYQSGYAKGEDEGLAAGTNAGAQAGYQQAYDESKEKIEALQVALQEVLSALQGMPDAISESLNEFVYEVALRISGAESLERGPFVAAIQEALMRLPLPGENVFLRIRNEEVETWNGFVSESALPFTCTVLIDADVPPGHAYVEISGARIDVGYEARKALVRSALGLSSPNDIP